MKKRLLLLVIGICVIPLSSFKPEIVKAHKLFKIKLPTNYDVGETTDGQFEIYSDTAYPGTGNIVQAYRSSISAYYSAEGTIYTDPQLGLCYNITVYVVNGGDLGIIYEGTGQLFY